MIEMAKISIRYNHHIRMKDIARVQIVALPSLALLATSRSEIFYSKGHLEEQQLTSSVLCHLETCFVRMRSRTTNQG